MKIYPQHAILVTGYLKKILTFLRFLPFRGKSVLPLVSQYYGGQNNTPVSNFSFLCL